MVASRLFGLGSDGSPAQLGDADHMVPPIAAIAEGATTPDPGILNALVFSSSTGSLMRWTGTIWTSVPASVTVPSLTLLETPCFDDLLVVYDLSSAELKRMRLGRAVGRTSYVRPVANATTVSALGLALTATGTATASGALSATNVHTSRKRLDYLVTTAATTAVAGFRSPQLELWMGNAAGRGGFRMSCTWGPATGVATATNRAFVGLTSATAAPTDVQPSTLTNMIGMGWDAADTNVQMLRNDGSGTATKIDLGSSFPVPTADRSEVYELEIWCAPNTTEVFWWVQRLSTGAEASGSFTTDLPANTQFLAPRGWMSVGGTSSVIGIALFNLQLVSDC